MDIIARWRGVALSEVKLSIDSLEPKRAKMLDQENRNSDRAGPGGRSIELGATEQRSARALLDGE